MRPRHLALPPLALALALTATSCGDGSSPSAADSPAASSPAAADGSTAPSGSAGAGAGAGDATAAGGNDDAMKADCASIPADLVSAVLDDTVGEPTENRSGANTAVCTYDGPRIGRLVIRIQTDQDAAGFAAAKKSYADHGMTTTEVPGFADKAYSSVTGTGANAVTTLVALMGSTEILVTAKSTVDQEKALVGEILSRTQP